MRFLKCDKCNSPMRIIHGPVSKKTNTKLKKYDKLIARNIKKDVVSLTEMRIPVIENGERTGTREFLKNILYA